MGADPHRPVSARVRRVRALPGHVRPMARAQSRDLPAPVRGPGVLPHRGQYDFVFVDCGKSEVSAGPVSVGLLHPRQEVDPLALRHLHHSLGGAGHPDHLLHPLHAQPGMGLVNSLIFRLTALDGPNWLTNPQLAMAMAMLVHIWKALPFWTLILMAGRLAIPKELYEASSVDGASGWQKFKYVTWPSIRTLYLTSTLLSMIWTLGDFNSVYLLTGGQPADQTHVLATLGIRYIRLDQVEQAMATIVVALPFVLPLVYFMMRRLSGDEQKTS